MRKFILPFEEYQKGWYEIEANSLEEAKQIVKQGDFTEYAEPNYGSGYTNWDIEELKEQN